MFVHSSVDRYLGYLHILSIEKDASMNMVCKTVGVQWLVLRYVLESSELSDHRKDKVGDRFKNDSW